MGINLLVVNGSSTETYKNGKLIKFNSDTIQNKKKKYSKLILDENKKTFKINGSSFKGALPSTALVGNWWNHSILQSEMIISPLSGSLKFQEVYFLSKETLKIKNDNYITSKFKIIMKKNIEDGKKHLTKPIGHGEGESKSQSQSQSSGFFIGKKGEEVWVRVVQEAKHLVTLLDKLRRPLVFEGAVRTDSEYHAFSWSGTVTYPSMRKGAPPEKIAEFQSFKLE